MVRASPLPLEHFADSYVGRKAVEFVEAYRVPRPLCMFVGFGGPHEPWDAPGKYAAMYNPAATPPPIPIPEAYAAEPPRAAKKDFEAWPQSVLDNVAVISANYFGKVSLIDDWVGRILDAFQRRGWLDDLLIVFWSDHGEMLCDHGRIFKQTFHESGVRVPLILRWPGQIPANTVTEALAENIDIFPTLLEAVGCEPSNRCQGKTLWPVLRDLQPNLRDYQLSEILHGERHIMIRSHRYKYAVDDSGEGFMLYDLDNDPHEQNNLLGRAAYLALEEEMREALLRRLVQSPYAMESQQR